MAWIKPRAGAEVDADQVREHCTGKLAHFKIPKHVHVLGADEEFPMTVTGKVKTNVLKERAAGTGADQLNPPPSRRRRLMATILDTPLESPERELR